MPDWSPGVEGGPKQTGGLISYLQAGLENGPDHLPPIEELVYTPRIAECLTPAGKMLSGKLYVLPAGNLVEAGKEYGAGELDVAKLYETETGVAILDRLKIDINAKLEPHYLFIDARTGITETSGVCILHLPDLVIFFTGLNVQHSDGARLVLQRLKLVKPDFAGNLLVVASPVPYGEEEAKAKRIERIQLTLGETLDIGKLPHIHSIPYHPRVAISEDTFTAKNTETFLYQAYDSLRDAIQSRNAEDDDYKIEIILKKFIDLDQWIHFLKDDVKSIAGRSIKNEIISRLRPLLDAKDDRITSGSLEQKATRSPFDALRLTLEALDLAKAGQLLEASKRLEIALDIDPNNTTVIETFAMILEQQGLYDKAESLFITAIKRDKNNFEVLRSYAFFLLKRLRIDEAESFLNNALSIKPNDPISLWMFGFFLYNVKNDVQQALRYTEMSLNILPNQGVPLRSKALYCTILGKKDISNKIYNELFSTPDSQSLLIETINELNGAFKKHPSNPHIQQTLTMLTKKLQSFQSTNRTSPSDKAQPKKNKSKRRKR
jgi:tetratricopeptide (TPR) repeat protein